MELLICQLRWLLRISLNARSPVLIHREFLPDLKFLVSVFRLQVLGGFYDVANNFNVEQAVT